MSFLSWTPILQVGVNAMDEEHKVLIGLMNDLHSANEKQAAHADLRRILTALVDYTKKHFADEEKYLESISYPELAVHKVVHQQLLSKLAENQKAFEAQQGPVPAAMFDFLNLWLNAHIKGIDMKYGAFSKATKKVANG